MGIIRILLADDHPVVREGIRNRLAREEDLIQIRTREVTSRPLAEVSEGVKATVKYANIFAPPALVILIGLFRWQIRRRRKSMEF